MYDLIVVGAGPAGASAARVAAQKGLKTLILEKERMPRTKLCGGGVTPKVLKLLDFALPPEIIERTAQSVRVHVGDNCFPFETSTPLAYMTSRAPFDSFLISKALDVGVELKDRSPVSKVENTSTHVELSVSGNTLKSRILIGADGMGGPTARFGDFYQQWQSSQVAYAIESEVPVGERTVQEFITTNSYFDIYFGVSPAGYGWVFPKHDHLTVGVGCRLSNLRDAKELLDAFTRRIPLLDNHEIPHAQAHLIPLGGVARVPTVRDRILLAGDSAGFAEPLFGEGIYFAIYGGQLAGRVAADACREERFDAASLGSYDRLWREAFGKDFDVAYRVASFSYLDNYDMDRVGRFFFKDKTVQDCMIKLMDGTLRYRDVQAKLAWPYFKYRLARLGFPFYS